MEVGKLKNNLPEFVQKRYDWRQIALKVENERFIAVPAPRIYQLEITNFCNLKCPMCPRKKMTRDIGFMDFDFFKRIIDQLDRPQAIELFGFGESVLHKNFLQMVEYCKNKGHYTVLATNGTKSMLHKYDILDFIVFDLDSEIKKVYESIRVGSNYYKVRRNIERFLKVKQHTFVVIQAIEMPGNESPVIYKDKWIKLGVDEIRIKFFDTFAGSVMMKNRAIKSEERQPCPEIFYGFDVWWDGTVVPCGRYFDASYTYGNLHKNSLLEIWNSDKANRLREIHRNKEWQEAPIRCQKCQEWMLTNLRFCVDISNNMFRGNFV